MHCTLRHSIGHLRALLLGTALVALFGQLAGLQCSCMEQFHTAHQKKGARSDLICRGIDPNSCEGPAGAIMCITSQLVHKQHPNAVFERRSCMDKSAPIKIGCNAIEVSDGAAVMYIYACDTLYCNDASYDDLCVRPSGPGAPFAIATAPPDTAGTDRVPADRPISEVTLPPPPIHPPKQLDVLNHHHNQATNELDRMDQQDHAHRSNQSLNIAQPNTSQNHIPTANPPAQATFTTSATTSTTTLATKLAEPDHEPELFIDEQVHFHEPEVQSGNDSHSLLTDPAESDYYDSSYYDDDDAHNLLDYAVEIDGNESAGRSDIDENDLVDKQENILPNPSSNSFKNSNSPVNTLDGHNMLGNISDRRSQNENLLVDEVNSPHFDSNDNEPILVPEPHGNRHQDDRPKSGRTLSASENYLIKDPASASAYEPHQLPTKESDNKYEEAMVKSASEVNNEPNWGATGSDQPMANEPPTGAQSIVMRAATVNPSFKEEDVLQQNKSSATALVLNYWVFELWVVINFSLAVLFL